MGRRSVADRVQVAKAFAFDELDSPGGDMQRGNDQSIYSKGPNEGGLNVRFRRWLEKPVLSLSFTRSS